MESKPARRDLIPPGDIVRGLVAFREQTRTFEIVTWIGQPTYDIEADRVLLASQFTDWIWQLQTKGWMTGQHFADLFRCLSDFIYRQYEAWPQDFYDVKGAIQQGMDKA